MSPQGQGGDIYASVDVWNLRSQFKDFFYDHDSKNSSAETFIKHVVFAFITEIWIKMSDWHKAGFFQCHTSAFLIIMINYNQ